MSCFSSINLTRPGPCHGRRCLSAFMLLFATFAALLAINYHFPRNASVCMYVLGKNRFSRRKRGVRG
uniref:Putative secreted protein n=1 Tax=Anopheles darlingi TaxID=43151 RepID=A0A2M4DI03_ANODA